MIQTTIRGVRLATIVLAAYWSLIFIATHIPKPPGISIPHLDKLVHLLAYSGLSFLLSWALPTIPRHKLLNVFLAGLLAVTYGVIDEYSQIPVGRQADFFDWVADSAGTILGLTIYVVARWQIVKRGKSQPVPSPRTLEALQA